MSDINDRWEAVFYAISADATDEGLAPEEVMALWLAARPAQQALSSVTHAFLVRHDEPLTELQARAKALAEVADTMRQIGRYEGIVENGGMPYRSMRRAWCPECCAQVPLTRASAQSPWWCSEHGGGVT